MAFTKIDHFILQIFLFVVKENITFSLHDGEILEAFIAPENMLIRHLCEHDTNILFTSAFRMTELYRFIQICPRD